MLPQLSESITDAPHVAQFVQQMFESPGHLPIKACTSCAITPHVGAAAPLCNTCNPLDCKRKTLDKSGHECSIITVRYFVP
jgi:hypothetical protein